ncbi:MAG: VOC family protein [Sphingomonas sp.]
MPTRIDLVMYPVANYDDAIAFFVECVVFHLTEDFDRGLGKRWVVVRPPGVHSTGLLLARQDDEQPAHASGHGADKVSYLLRVDDLAEEYSRMRLAGVHFLEEPRYEVYGTVAVFEYLYRNKWDLIGPARAD